MDVASMDVVGAKDMGISCTMELRNIANLQDLRNPDFVEKALRVLNTYNSFGSPQTVSFATDPRTFDNAALCGAESVSDARTFVQVSAGAHVLFRSFPEERYATLCVFSSAAASDRRKAFFEIYDYMAQAFAAEYHSECISFVEHRA